jgi:hypothetical protein
MKEDPDDTLSVEFIEGRIQWLADALNGNFTGESHERLAELGRYKRETTEVDRVHRRLEESGAFDRMAEASGLPLREFDRWLIATYIEGYETEANWNRSGRKQRLKAQRKLVRDAESLAARLEADQWSSSAETAAASLRDYAAFQKDVDNRLPHLHGNRSRMEDDVLISCIAQAYIGIGGRIGISSNGPFTRFLRVVWEALPRGCRPSSAERLVARTKARLPELRRMDMGGLNNVQTRLINALYPVSPEARMFDLES